MKILVTGSTGMLGSEVMRALHERQQRQSVGTPEIEFEGSLGHANLDLAEPKNVRWLLNRTRPDVVINCAGVIPRRSRSVAEMVAVNAVLPHLLADLCEERGARLVHVSTDCVFDGARDLHERYALTDVPDATDLYGRSKALGEPSRPHVLIVRTSFVGPRHGLWAWLASNAGGKVEGYRSWLWTGSTVAAVAGSLGWLAESHADYYGRTIHLATEGWLSKAQVLELLAQYAGIEVEIENVDATHRNMALAPDVSLGPFEDALAGYCQRLRAEGEL